MEKNGIASSSNKGGWIKESYFFIDDNIDQGEVKL